MACPDSVPGQWNPEGIHASDEKAFEILQDDDDLIHDMKCSGPIYNYARLHQWSEMAEEVHQYYRNATYRSHMKVPVHGLEWDRVTDATHHPNRNGSAAEVRRYCEGDDRQIPPLQYQGRLKDILVSCIVACTLQWGCMGAAIIAFIYQPTQVHPAIYFRVMHS